MSGEGRVQSSTQTAGCFSGGQGVCACVFVCVCTGQEHKPVRPFDLI